MNFPTLTFLHSGMTVLATSLLAGLVIPPALASPIVGQQSNRCIDIAGGSWDNGIAAALYDCNWGPNQDFSLQNRGNGQYQLVISSSGKCLDVDGWATWDGGRVQQWDCSGGTNQLWTLQDQGNGLSSLINVNSGKCLDASGDWDGAGLQQYSCWGGQNQSWNVQGASQTYAQPQPQPQPPNQNLYGPPPGYDLVFSDEFDWNNLDTGRWWTRYIYGDGYTDYLNNEAQRYRENWNHIMSGGNLELTARINGDGNIESGMIRSKTTFKYGYFEGRFLIPAGQGVFPAFWLNSDFDPNFAQPVWPPEYDVFEFALNYGSEKPNMIHTAPVVQSGYQDGSVISEIDGFNDQYHFYAAPDNYTDGWHTIAALWDTDDTIATYVDGVLIHKVHYLWKHNDGNDAPNAHILVNLAIGDPSWAGANGIDMGAFPQALKVDYIRAYQKSGQYNLGTSTIGHDLCPWWGGC